MITSGIYIQQKIEINWNEIQHTTIKKQFYIQKKKEEKKWEEKIQKSLYDPHPPRKILDH